MAAQVMNGVRRGGIPLPGNGANELCHRVKVSLHAPSSNTTPEQVTQGVPLSPLLASK